MMECKELTARKHIASKGIGRIESEPCGRVSKFEIQYTINRKTVKKELCGMHLNSVTSWLKKIGVTWTQTIPNQT